MWQISKDFAFSASHVLMGLPDGHPCGRLHGHNYRVRVHVSADELDDVGFVVDYGDLKPLGVWLDAEFDHRHLNSVLDGRNPTAENLAAVIYDRVLSLVGQRPGVRVAVSVSETPKTWATFRP